MASLVTAAVDNVTSSILPLLGAAGAAAAAGAGGGASGLNPTLGGNATSSLSPRLGSGPSGNVTCVFSSAHNTSLCTTESAGSTQPFITTPAPHTLPHPVWLLVIFGILAGVVAFVTNLGNIMVLVAFGLERTIRQPTNYFLASLAVSDLLIGTFSMPLYTQYLLQDQWVLGPWLCDLWLSLDWTVCLTSQYTVFLITMDRFLSVKIPAKYRNWRTERKVLIMIALTWIVPACVFFTSVIGWQYFVGERTVGDRVCEVQFMSDAMFTFLLTIAYYWITLFVMCILYGGIYKVALDLQRKSDAKQAKMKSTMALAGDNPAAALRHFGEPDDGLGEGSMNNSSGGGDSNIPPPSAPPPARNSVKQKNSTAKPVQNNINQNPNNRKSIKAALPCPPGAQNVNTTSFSVKKQNARADGAEEDRSSSPAFDSDDENFGGKSGNGPPGKGSQRDSALFTNTGGLVRSLHGDLFFNPSQAAAAIVSGVSKSNSTNKTLPTTAAAATTTTPVTPGAASGTTNSTATASPNYLQPPAYSSLGFASDTASDAEGSSSGGLHRDAEFDSVYSSSASDHRLDKQTTPLLSKQEKEQSSHQSSNHTDIINKGRSFIDEKSFLAASLHSDRAALLPAMMMTVSGVTPGVCGNTSDGQTVEEEEDSDVADLDHASSPIWKRRTSLPPLATDVFELEGEEEEEDDDDDDDDDDQSDSLFITEYTTTGCEEDALATTPTYAPGQLRLHPHQHHHTPSDNSHEDLSNKSADTVKCLGPSGGAMQPLQQRPRTDTVNTMTSETTTYADTVTDDYSNSNSNASPAHQNFHNKGDATTGQIPNNLSVSFKGGAAVEAGINNTSSPFFNTSSINNNNSGGSASGSGSGSNAANANNPAPSETNTNDDSSRSETHCLAAVRRRRDRSKDPNRLHSFVKSVRSRNSRRRNRRERKSKSENRARKALRTISFILGAFVCCWTPYHVAIMFMAMCSGCVNPLVYKFTYWMCYLNSPINPFCYAFANAQFKRTFLRILRFDWHRT